MPISPRHILSVAFFVAFSPLAPAGPALEAQELALALKQLEQVQTILERAAIQSKASASNRETRFLFDYELVQEDLRRVSSGIRSYMTPSRAQPRDIEQITGEYSRDQGQP